VTVGKTQKEPGKKKTEKTVLGKKARTAKRGLVHKTIFAKGRAETPKSRKKGKKP